MNDRELKQGFVSHLRMHSHYSVGQSASTPEELMSEISRINSKEFQIASAALTDFNSLSGSLKFSKSAESHKTSQPIIGYDCQITLNKHGKGIGRVLLLAMNEKGFKRLCDIQMLAYRNIENPSSKKNSGENPYLALLLDDLLENNEDIIVLSGKNEEGLFYQLFKHKGHDFALNVARNFLKVFGDRFYLEFCRNALGVIREENGIHYDERHQSELFLQEIMRGGLGDVMCDDGVSRSYVMPVATSDIWYATEERHLAWKIMQANYQHLNLTVSGIAPMAIPSDASPDMIKSKPPYFMEGVGDVKIHLDDIDRYHIRTRDDMEKLFPDMPYAIDNANIIASRCYFHPKGRTPVLPPFKKLINGQKIQVNEEEELREQSYEGLKERIKEENISRERLRKQNNIKENTEDEKYRVIKTDKSDAIYNSYLERLERELGIILSMGFPGYFLIVSDFIKWSKSQNIPVGPGRGSGAGSLVAYSLRIIDVDPMKYGLLFERFLNPERVSMPDFDIDFCQTRRDEVIKYVSENYGSDQVSQIATFGQIKPKSSIGVIQRSLIVNGYGLTVNDTNVVSKALSSNPSLSDVPLCYYYQDNSWLSNKDEKFEKLADEMHFLLKSEVVDSRRNIYLPITSEEQHKFNTKESRIGVPKVSVLMNYGSLINDLYKSRGAHAGGVIIGGEKLTNLFPIMLDEATLNPISAYDQKDSEASGAVKFDFLGLKNLTIIQDAVDYAKEFSSFYRDGFFSDNGKPNDLKIDNITIDDPYVFKTVVGDNLRTCGIFQLSSAGMKSVIKKIKPESLAHICAINALFRPGPMKYIDSFARRRNSEEEIVYPGNEKDTKSILEETFGYMIYQEQVMQVAQKVAGYSLGGADVLRRAMGKKIASEMDKQRKIFIHGDGKKTEGAIKYSGMTENAANKLFDDINAFANYGFNKSHSLAYSLVSYQTMWLKAYYPACFLSAVASYESKSLEANEDIINEAKDMGIPVLPPDVNNSRLKFCPEVINENIMGIRYGFSGLKRLVNFDPQNNKPEGGYVDIIDFIVRNHPLNKANIENIINSGALDNIGFNVDGWNSLPDINNDNTIEYTVKSFETKIETASEHFEEQKEKIKDLRKIARKSDDKEKAKKDIDDAVQKREELKQEIKDLNKKLKIFVKKQEATKDEQDALSYKGSLVSIINDVHEKYKEELKDDVEKYKAYGRVRAILKSVYLCFNDVRKIINPMIKDDADVEEIVRQVRIELLKSEDIKKAFLSSPITPVDVMVGEKGVFEWYFNVHPLIVNKHVFKSVGAYPPSAWIKYLRANGGAYPNKNVFTNLMEQNTPNYALVAGMVAKEPRISEREYTVDIVENGIKKKVVRKKQRISLTITDHNGVTINCGHDFDMPEHNEVEYILEKNETGLKKQNVHMEVRDRPLYLFNLLKRCYKSKRPVVLKGVIMSMNGGAWFVFSWGVQIDDVLDRIPGRNLLITIDEKSIVNQNNLDAKDSEDIKEIDNFYERTLRSIRKEIFLSMKKKIINKSENSVFLRDERTKKVTVAENIESGGGANIVIARKKLDGRVEYYFLNKSDEKGKSVNDEYYDARYMIADSVKTMIFGKPYVSSAEFTKEKFEKGTINRG